MWGYLVTSLVAGVCSSLLGQQMTEDDRQDWMNNSQNLNWSKPSVHDIFDRVACPDYFSSDDEISIVAHDIASNGDIIRTFGRSDLNESEDWDSFPFKHYSRDILPYDYHYSPSSDYSPWREYYGDQSYNHYVNHQHWNHDAVYGYNDYNNSYLSLHSGTYGSSYDPASSSHEHYLEEIRNFKVYKRVTPPRTYWQNMVSGERTWICAEFTLPEVNIHQFCYIQFWFIDGKEKTTELGIRKRPGKRHFRPLVFSTDDDYRSGYFADKFSDFRGGSSSQRLKDHYRDSYKQRFHPGDKIRIVVSKENDAWYMWINKDLVSSINTDFTSIRSDFGTETNLESGPVFLTDLRLDYSSV
ncbi:TPA_asm: P5 [Chrysanthemum trirhavirus 1]|nr:TPA_asm: P5 [Chrysanthemum trirhavirus 1]